MSLFLGRLFLVLSLGSFSVNFAWAQQPAEMPEPAFEAATIRPSHVEGSCYSMLPPGGTHYTVTCVPLRNLIAVAWKLHPDNVQGVDAGALSTYYDVNAITSGEKAWDFDAIRLMLRQMLAERFHVTVHRGTKQVSGYALIVAKGGPKLKPANFDAAQLGTKAGEPVANHILPGSIQGRGANLGLIATLLSSPAHATVVDRTGITGVFNVDLHYAYEGGTDASLPDLFTAVEEQLGLKLQAEKITVDTLVVDHADSEPTPN
jgi:uncharacterized protein (TIGR03435 family)